MDIREPLSTLKNLLEQRLGVELPGYEFWLQNAQMVRSFPITVFHSFKIILFIVGKP